MSIRFETTVGQVMEEIAKLDLPGDRRVSVTVLDEEDAAKHAELRRLIDEGMASGPPIDGEEAITEVLQELTACYPELANKDRE